MRVDINGEQAFYGTGSGRHAAGATPIVFVHGAGFDHSVWVMPARYFARHGFNVIAPDLPGHGRSQGAALERIEDMADWVVELLQTVCPDKAGIIVGHSMGSLVALAAAERHPDAVRRLALLGAALPMPVGPPLLEAAEDNHHAAIDMANTWSHSARGQLGAGANPGLHNLHSGERWLERMADGVYHDDLAACNRFVPPAALPDVGTLIIAGASDRMTPLKGARALAERLPRADLVVIDDCGHSMLAEDPNAVLDALADFVLR